MAQPTKRFVNVLFTSVGRRVELLRAFRRAYQALDLPGQIIAVDIDPLAPALQLADRPYIVPRLTSPDYMPALLEICRREQVDLIFPLIDPDIPMLAAHADALKATGARVAVVSAQAAAMTADKYATTRFFQALDVPTPQTWLPGAIDSKRATYPLFIKPRRGSAARATYRIDTPQELEFFLHYVPDPLIQELIPGPEITSDVICDTEGEILAVVSRQRIEVRWGEVAKGVTVYNPAVVAACVKIAQALPAVGPITVQCLMKGEIPHFTEINARLGGGVPLGIAAGVDSPQWLLARVLGLPVEIPPLGQYQAGLYMTRFDDAYFLPENDYEQMAHHHL